MIASPVPGQRWLFVLLVSVVAATAWRSRPVAEPAPAGADPDVRVARLVRPVTYRYVPLLGTPLYDAVDEADGDYHDRPVEAPPGPVKTCLPFLAPILEHPSWQLRITHANDTCFGAEVLGDFTIASTGEVTWTRPGWPVRRLALSSDQLALVRRLDRLSCVRLQRDRRDDDFLVIGLDLGAFDELGGASISPASTLGRAVTAMLDELTAAYRRPRREVIGSMDLYLATTEPGAVYHVRVTGGGLLTVKCGRQLLVAERVEPDLLVDLVDAALERRAVEAPEVEGVLLLHGSRVPVALTRLGPSPFDQIHRAIASARYLDASPAPALR